LSEIIYYPEIDSTNSEAWRLLDRQQAAVGDVIIAKRQSQGRGQRGHHWQSDLGGLFMSVILQPQIAAIYAHQITLWTAWGIAKALRETGANVKIKWLNDLVIDRRKLGGILTETRIESGWINYAVVGVGINWTNVVPDGAIALGELPTTLSSLDELIEVVRWGIALGQQRYIQAGITDILVEYLEMLHSRQVLTNIEGQEHRGNIIDIRPTGELVVRWEKSSQDALYQPHTFSVGY
jgi:BirA family biotin operon repressor/biotin-[acetyl-CoA-carboxylase] ligase